MLIHPHSQGSKRLRPISRSDGWRRRPGWRASTGVERCGGTAGYNHRCRTVAEEIIAQIGTDRGQLRSAAQLAREAKLCSGQDERAGKGWSGKTGQGRAVTEHVVQAAWAAVKVKDSYLGGGAVEESVCD